MNSTSNIEVVGSLTPFEEPVQSHHSATTKPLNSVSGQVYRGELLQTNEVLTPGLIVLGVLLVLTAYTLKRIRDLSKE